MSINDRHTDSRNHTPMDENVTNNEIKIIDPQINFENTDHLINSPNSMMSD